MSSIEPADSRLIQIDSEHAMRLVGPVLALVIVVIIHIIGLTAFRSALSEITSPTCVMLIIDVMVFVAVWNVIERIIKRVRPSARYATLSAKSLIITDARHEPPQSIRIEWDKAINIKAWKFTINRRTRIPKGWYCMSLHLLQDETEAIIYTFMSPEEAETAVGFRRFTQLHPRQHSDSNTDLNALAEQRRLHKLEELRWMDGAEISPEDFSALLTALQRHVPAWS